MQRESGALIGYLENKHAFDCQTDFAGGCKCGGFAAGPAAAQKSRHSARPVAGAAYQTLPEAPAAINPADPTVVTVDGNYIGRDPDPQIRSDLLKNQSDHEGNTY